MIDWINIDIQQPEQGQKVVIYLEDYDAITIKTFVKLQDGSFLFYGYDKYDYYPIATEDNVFEWMPLGEKK